MGKKVLKKNIILNLRNTNFDYDQIFHELPAKWMDQFINEGQMDLNDEPFITKSYTGENRAFIAESLCILGPENSNFGSERIKMDQALTLMRLGRFHTEGKKKWIELISEKSLYEIILEQYVPSDPPHPEFDSSRYPFIKNIGKPWRNYKSGPYESPKIADLFGLFEFCHCGEKRCGADYAWIKNSDLLAYSSTFDFNLFDFYILPNPVLEERRRK